MVRCAVAMLTGAGVQINLLRIVSAIQTLILQYYTLQSTVVVVMVFGQPAHRWCEVTNDFVLILFHTSDCVFVFSIYFFLSFFFGQM